MRRFILPTALFLLACSGLDELNTPEAPATDPITVPVTEEAGAPAAPEVPEVPEEGVAQAGEEGEGDVPEEEGAEEEVAEDADAVAEAPAPSSGGSCADRIEGVTRHSSTRYTLSEAYMDRYVRDQQRASNQGSGSWRKNKKKKTVGARIRNLRCAPQVAGLQDGDILKEVNGQPLTSTVAALSAYETVKSADRFTVKLRRNNQPLTIQYTVE